MPFFIVAHTVGKFSNYFCEKFCCQDFAKVAQSGNTAWNQEKPNPANSDIEIILESIFVDSIFFDHDLLTSS